MPTVDSNRQAQKPKPSGLLMVLKLKWNTSKAEIAELIGVSCGKLALGKETKMPQPVTTK